ncbi:MAG: tetratricopeptide repeat protein [Rhodothermales bacterium]
MSKLSTFIRNQQKYYIVYLVCAFVFFAITWFLTHPPAPVGVKGRAMETVTTANGEFTPDASNVMRSTTEQLDALRLRVVNAPEDTTHVFRLARMLQDAHKLDEAARNYKHYLALRPNNKQAWLDYAQCLGGTKSWDEAQDAINRMLELYPEDPSGLYNLGAIYANQSLISEAKSVWTPLSQQNEDVEIAAMAKSSLDRLESFVKPQWVAGK